MNFEISIVYYLIAFVVIVLSVLGILSRYKRSAPDELLVVFGRAGQVKTEDGQKVTTPSKIIQGGGTFVIPIIQDFKRMSMAPKQIKVSVDGIDSQAIPIHLPVVLTTAISKDKIIQQNAATRFLSADTNEVINQVKEILVGETRAIMATMPIEQINADRTTFLTKVRESLEMELAKIGYDVTNINISEITDDANYIKNLGKKAATKAQANAEADIAEQLKQGNVKIANTKKEESIAVAAAEKEQAVTVNQTKQEQEVTVAEIDREKAIRLAEAEKDRESGVAAQNAIMTANVARSEAEAMSEKAKADAERMKNVAKVEADAMAAQNEAEAQKQIRIAQAEQSREAETIKATQEKESKAAEYESEKRKRKAEADKQAGVAEQEAKIDVAAAIAKAGKAEADAKKVKESAMVEAEANIARTRQERQLEVNEAEAKANEARLNATEVIPAKKMKEKTIIEAEALKEKMILEAEAEKQRILKEAEAQAEATRIKLEAEAEGTKKKLLAEADGKRASLMAEAEALQQKELAPAMAFERMIEAAGSPEMAVSWKMADHWEGIAGAQSEALSRINLGNVTVYGDANTGGQFARSVIENLAPALSMINGGIKDQFTTLFSGKKKDSIEEKQEV